MVEHQDIEVSSKKESKKMVGLSKRQKVVLEFIDTFITKNNYAPSNREIGVGVYLSSPSTVQHHLDELKRKGYITWRKGEIRTIQLLKKEEAFMKVYKCDRCSFHTNDEDSLVAHLNTHNMERFRSPDMMLIDADKLEHLLNCMANKNFIHEQTEETQKEWQSVYDMAWNEGMALLSKHRLSKLVPAVGYTEDVPEDKERATI
jgi:SOS-response transcriptional repressor LexA